MGPGARGDCGPGICRRHRQPPLRILSGVGAEAAAALVLALATATTPAVHIYCGPGLGNCGDRPEAIHSSPGWRWQWQAPGVVALVGTDITCEYQIAGGVWDVIRQRQQRTVSGTLAAAEDEGVAWAQELQAAGISP